MLTDQEKALVERAKSDFRGPGVGDEDVWWLLKLIDRLTTEPAILDAAEGILRRHAFLGGGFAEVSLMPGAVHYDNTSLTEPKRANGSTLSEAVAKLKGGG